MENSDGIQILPDYRSSGDFLFQKEKSNNHFCANKFNKKKDDIWDSFDLLDSHEPVFKNDEYQEEEFDDWQTVI